MIQTEEKLLCRSEVDSRDKNVEKKAAVTWVNKDKTEYNRVDFPAQFITFAIITQFITLYF